MKTILHSLFVASSLTLISAPSAQADRYKSVAPKEVTEVAAQNKLKNDLTYSTAAYKHPNKITAARQWEPESGVEFRIRNRKAQEITGYREHQRLGGLGDTAIAIPSKPAFVNRNYKPQNGIAD
ncbi:hypothetical protein [Larkinella punicea]|uniref:Uncharacterized protein n=1 Tax=Larkinella punicea TaxID=2315727 RepID=A0A368JWW1_9BACT|nr:hypothetical protein [Larkinella punicea]RCR71164.1 hypothetical protein DUE52_02635 [Larkinella punicea]